MRLEICSFQALLNDEESKSVSQATWNHVAEEIVDFLQKTTFSKDQKER